MENSVLGTKILMEMEKLIGQTVIKGKMTKKVQHFHEAIIQKHYNATDVVIDYHRHRVKMHVVVDEQPYDPTKINLNLSLLPTNLFFKNLQLFLKSCLERDAKSLAFYSGLIKNLTNRETIALQY